MVKSHLKRQGAPTSWKTDRKGYKFIVRPKPGKKLEMSMPLSIIFKNVLKYCKTTKEVKSILHDKEIIVDGKRRKDHRYSMGMMDTMRMPVSKENYRMLINSKGKLVLVSISDKEAELKPCRVVDKTLQKSGKIQLNFSDGRTFIYDGKDKISTGDTVLLNLNSKKIEKIIPLEKGSYGVVIRGKHLGKKGTIENIESKTVMIKTEDKELIPAKKAFVFVVGDKKPLIKLTE